MRWLSWLILAYLVLGLQSGLSGYLGWNHVPPNLVLIVVIFLSLNAPREPALAGAFVVGLMQDVLTQEPMGTYALTCGLVTLMVQASQPVVYRDHPLTHFSLTLGGCVVSSLVLLVQGMIWPPRPQIMTLVTYCLYTAALAPVLLWPLGKLKWLFAFQPPRKLAGKRP